MTVIKDWVVQAQWDDSKIKKGLQRLEKSFNKINNSRSVRAMSRNNKFLEREIKLKSKSYRNEVKAAKQRNKEHAEALKMNKAFDQQKERIHSDALKMNKAFDVKQAQALKDQLRLTERRKDVLTKIEDIQYRLGVQQQALSKVKGGEGELSAVRGRQQQLTSLKTGVLAGGISAASLKDLERQIIAVSKATTRANPKINQMTRSLTAQKFAVNSLTQSFKNFSRSWLSFFAIAAGGLALYDIGEQLDQTKASLLAVSGSSQQVIQDWEFIKQTALGLGTDLKVSAKGYQQIGVAAKTMGFSMEQGKNIFLAASESARAFNLSIDDQMGVQRAFVQIMSKGTVSMEELKSQLGDRMPSAMAIAAKSMGYGNERMGEFIKLVSEGKVQSREFILKFSDALRQNVRETGALKASLETVNTARLRFVTSFQMAVEQGFGEATEGISSFFNTLSALINENVGLFKTLGRVVGGLFHTIVFFINLLRPFLHVISVILNEITETFSNAFDTDVAVEKLNLLERILRVIGGTIKIIIGSVMYLLSYLYDITDAAQGMSEAFTTFSRLFPNIVKSISDEMTPDFLKALSLRNLAGSLLPSSAKDVKAKDFVGQTKTSNKTINIVNPQLNIQNPVNGDYKDAATSIGETLGEVLLGGLW